MFCTLLLNALSRTDEAFSYNIRTLTRLVKGLKQILGKLLQISEHNIASHHGHLTPEGRFDKFVSLINSINGNTNTELPILINLKTNFHDNTSVLRVVGVITECGDYRRNLAKGGLHRRPCLYSFVFAPII